MQDGSTPKKLRPEDTPTTGTSAGPKRDLVSGMQAPTVGDDKALVLICGSAHKQGDFSATISGCNITKKVHMYLKLGPIDTVFAVGQVYLCAIEDQDGDKVIIGARRTTDGIKYLSPSSLNDMIPTEEQVTTSGKLDGILCAMILKTVEVAATNSVTIKTTGKQAQLCKGRALTMCRKSNGALGTRMIQFAVWDEDAALPFEPGYLFAIIIPKREMFMDKVVFTPSLNRGCVVSLLHQEEEIAGLVGQPPLGSRGVWRVSRVCYCLQRPTPRIPRNGDGRVGPHVK